MVAESSQIEHSSLEIGLKRIDRIYRPGEIVNGSVIVSARGGWQHKGILMRVVGAAKMSTGKASSSGLFDSVSSQAGKSRELMRVSTEIAAPGRVGDGVSEVPFSFELKPLDGSELKESYHGVYLNVCYSIHCECKRGVMKAPLEKELEFIVEVPTDNPPAIDPRDFSITPESLENVRATSLSSIPRFVIAGKLHRQSCPINSPFTGDFVIQESEAIIRSVELQLVRSETVRDASGASHREATEIQVIQIADGDVSRNLVLPIYMIFPRLFTCPTMITQDFRIEFELNLIVLFADGYMVTENFPIKLHRFR